VKNCQVIDVDRHEDLAVVLWVFSEGDFTPTQRDVFLFLMRSHQGLPDGPPLIDESAKKSRSLVHLALWPSAPRPGGLEHWVSMPQRFQRSRRKGARLPVDVIVVSRPTKWGNPHPLELGRQEAVRRYRDELLAGRLAITVEDVKRELCGRDLACYCPLDEPCHADVLIAVANA
jgi:hypothetical protein